MKCLSLSVPVPTLTLHRCFQPGLRSLSRGKLGLRVVVSSTTEGTHQPVGDESSSFGLVSFQSNSPSQISGSGYVSEPQAGHFCFSSSRFSSIRCRRNVNLLERNVCLRILSLQVSFPKSFKRCLRNLARSFLLHRLGQNKPGSQICYVSLVQDYFFFLSEWIYCLSWKEEYCRREPASACMVSFRKGIRQKGFSVRATNHISKAVQQSTEIVYAAKWSIFVDWCVGREIDPIKVSVQQLADFFVHLFEDKGLLPSTIKGYRSSITRTLTISGGTDFSNNEFLSLLIRNFDLERPKQKRLVPQWDLGLVLSALKLPPFEAATEVDLKFVSYKCCFLLALASGRRRSEIHALSVSDSCLRFNRDQPAVTLLTSFLGNNQIPCKSSEPIFIPALPSDSSSDLLCPIRILKIYLNRTRQKI